MTLPLQLYAIRHTLISSMEDCLEISRLQQAVFWTDAAGVRVLFFHKGHLVWTQWKPTREEAIDEAYRVSGKWDKVD